MLQDYIDVSIASSEVETPISVMTFPRRHSGPLQHELRRYTRLEIEIAAPAMKQDTERREKYSLFCPISKLNKWIKKNVTLLPLFRPTDVTIFEQQHFLQYSLFHCLAFFIRCWSLLKVGARCALECSRKDKAIMSSTFKFWWLANWSNIYDKSAYIQRDCFSIINFVPQKLNGTGFAVESLSPSSLSWPPMKCAFVVGSGRWFDHYLLIWQLVRRAKNINGAKQIESPTPSTASHL